MISVYGFNKSRSTRVLWALEEAKQTYTYKHMSFKLGEQKSEQYLQLNPASKMPVLKHNSFTLTESAAIVNYIATQFSSTLIPHHNTSARAEYDRWCYFVLTELEQGLWSMRKHQFALPEQYRIPQMLETAAWEYQKALNILSIGLNDKPYILGDTFTAADILITHTLSWGKHADQPLEQQNLINYLEKNCNRPALKRAYQRESTTQPGEKK